MKYIHLNHRLIKREVNVFALTLLIFGSLVSGATLFYVQHVTQKIAQLETAIETLKPTRFVGQQRRNNGVESSVSSQMRATQLAQTTAVNAAIKEITLPWPALFRALESTNREDIKLLSVLPNVKQQSLHMVALALNTDAMMAYMEALSRQAVLTNVVLVSQQSADVQQQKVIEFSIEAVWKI